MKILINDIRELVTGAVFNRGVQYFKQRRVNLTKVELDKFEAEVVGSDIYLVYVASANGELHTNCTCPYWDTCKHVVAAMFKAKEYYDENRAELIKKKNEPKWKIVFDNLLYDEKGVQHKSYKSSKPKNWKVIFTIELSDNYWILTPQQLYIKQDGTLGRINPIGSFDMNNESILFAPNDPIIINYLQSKPGKHYLYPYNNRYNYYYYNYNSKVMEYGENIGMVFDLMKESTVYQIMAGQLLQTFTFDAVPAQAEFQFEKQNDSYLLKTYLLWREHRLPLTSEYRIMTSNPVWLLLGNTFIKLENCRYSRLLDYMIRSDTKIKIAEPEFSQFINNYFHKLDSFGTFKLPESFHVKSIKQISGKRIYLKEGEKHLQADLKFLYGQVEIDLTQAENELYRTNLGESLIFKVVRDLEAESAVTNKLLDSGLKINREGGFQIVDSKALFWIFEQIPTLVQQGFEIYGKENLTKYKYNTARPRINFSVKSNIDWFDLNVEIDFDGIELSLKELRKAFQKKTRFVKLIDGSLAKLPDDWFIKFEHLFNFGKVEDKNVQLSKYHVPLIDLMLEKADQIQTDEQFQQRLARLKTFKQIDSQSLPQNFHGVLREYQKAGFDWLYFLQDFSFGGCLADDMGLGKTIQALALLLNEKEQSEPRTSLIICPTSVIFNWENEVEKFAPDLRVLNQTGIDRRKNTEQFHQYDIVLTSYGTLIRDVPYLARFPFHYVILDESQKMKNPASLTAKSTRLLQCNYRLALTGTPIENNTHELWSLFSFLNPGLLGSLNYFRKAFSSQIEKKKNEDMAEQLRRLIFPFILRRTKNQVENELPPKIEQISFCHMNDEQQKLYRRWRDYYRALILNQIGEVGLDQSRMRVLEGLTKLRLIACHPQLVEKEINEDSGKFEHLQDALLEIISEDHKVLVFSQFVKMLILIRNHLDKQQIVYEYLDGRTRNREQCVKRFQTDDKIKIFLISLKAGGTGLNLTAADYVIHYDPWWNPAVEVQATDRTHRIGQDRKVFVYKLITKDSVEEKILQLQEQKRTLVSKLITTDSSFLKSITKEDIEILFS